MQIHTYRPTFRDIRRNQSVEQYSAWPALLNCMIWVVYGLPFVHPNSGLLISINGIGVLIEFAYVALFLRYSAGEVRHMVSLLLVAGVATVVVVAGMVLGLAHTEERRSMLMGMIGVASGSGMYVSQLGTMVRSALPLPFVIRQCIHDLTMLCPCMIY